MEPMNIDYNDHSEIQLNTIKTNLDVVSKAMEIWTEVHSESMKHAGTDPSSCQQTINIADFGSSYGRNSLVPLCTIISKVRQLFTRNDISVFHNDLPQNDFGHLFQEISTNPSSYHKLSNNIYSYAVGCSFYNQVFPANSIHIAIAFCCLHWASKLTSPIPDTIFYQHSSHSELKEKWMKETRDDLITLLEKRGNELVVGGIFIGNFLTNDNDSFESSRMFYRQVKLIWNDMARDGLISEEEAHNMVYPFRFYTLENIQSAIRHPRVSPHGLELRYCELRKNSCPYQSLVEQHGAHYFAEKLFKVFSAFIGPYWRSNLKAGASSDLVWEEYTQRFIDYFTENPQHGCIPNSYHIVILEKTTSGDLQQRPGDASC
ncbi:hypothetical protein SAMD00019534_105960 [Acytostelium subglobosum LB1]|uniref:hypothetical protein n=1 Tax=Acytostelium subglobosum LB1 TaxID=1410327 RepID=UPI0006448E34|nr:hypothetical protein SAMD00019534_105960 [Acytostelium subglobosum LB1]GAM27420.1 hypothetical protein SAMD00019534_105960 [Acytostelium subglobosum LB1]|eukprot:XP_012749485.1 hypothetical protein SAMD00019534_105960 [Acytostelium subglobosum LB1]